MEKTINKKIAVGLAVLSGASIFLLTGLYVQQMQENEMIREHMDIQIREATEQIRQELAETQQMADRYEDGKDAVQDVVGDFLDAYYLMSDSREVLLFGIERYVTDEVYGIVETLSEHREYELETDREYCYYSSYSEVDPVEQSGEVIALFTVRSDDRTESYDKSYLFHGLVEAEGGEYKISRIYTMGEIQFEVD